MQQSDHKRAATDKWSTNSFPNGIKKLRNGDSNNLRIPAISGI